MVNGKYPLPEISVDRERLEAYEEAQTKLALHLWGDKLGGGSYSGYNQWDFDDNFSAAQ
jgi:hypothetical protein